MWPNRKHKQETGLLLGEAFILTFFWGEGGLNHLRNNGRKQHVAVWRPGPGLEGSSGEGGGGGLAAAGRTLSKSPRGPFNIY